MTVTLAGTPTKQPHWAKPESRGWRCEECGGEGRGRPGARDTEASIDALARYQFAEAIDAATRCPACDGLGCSVMAEWARRTNHRVARLADHWHVTGGSPFSGTPGLVMFWVLAGQFDGWLEHWPADVAARLSEPASAVVEGITSMPRSLCTLPEQWDRQIDIRVDPFFVPIDEVVDGKAVRRSGTAMEAARVRATAAKDRYVDEVARLSRDQVVHEANARYRHELFTIGASIAGIDPFEPEWHTAWWLALREWTTAGVEPDPDAMADILRGLGYERRREQVATFGGGRAGKTLTVTRHLLEKFGDGWTDNAAAIYGSMFAPQAEIIGPAGDCRRGFTVGDWITTNDPAEAHWLLGLPCPVCDDDPGGCPACNREGRR